MEIRGEEVLLPVSAVSAFPRPHWLQGRVLGSLSEPVYRSHNLRVAYEDACKICAGRAGEGGPGHPVRRRAVLRVGGARLPAGADLPLHPGEPGRLRAVRAARRGRQVPAVLPGRGQGQDHLGAADLRERGHDHAERHQQAVQGGVPRPGPAEHHRQGRVLRRPAVAVARDLAIALNQELKYLVSMGLEAVQLIDVLPPYTTDMWQIEMQNILFDGVDAIKFWHVCYGSVDGQRDIFDDHAAAMMPLFKESPADVIHLEFTNKGFDELDGVPRLPDRQGARRGRGGRQEPAGGDRRADRGADPPRAGGGARPTGCWSRRTAGWATSAGPRPTPSCATWGRPRRTCGAKL